MAATAPLPDLVLYSRPAAACAMRPVTSSRACSRTAPRRASRSPASGARHQDRSDLERELFDRIPVVEIDGERLELAVSQRGIRRWLRGPARAVRRVSGDDLTILVALAAGLISFLSPCVLPLVPAYLGQLTAVAVAGQEPGATPSAGCA